MGTQCDLTETEGARLLFAQGTQSTSQERLPARAGRLRRAVRHCIQHEPLLLATLAGVAVGVVLGTALSFANLSTLALDIIGLPGELLMRTLKMLVLPLITASVMAGVCALRQSTADMGKVARYTLLYYFSTTMGAVVLGIVIVNVVQPGRGAPFDQLDSSSGGASSCHAANLQKVANHTATAGQQHSPAEALLGVIKSAFPDNVFLAAANMNVLGIITVSLLLGAALSSMGPEAAPMVNLINIFNEAIGKIVNWVIWTSPVGIASLITTSICKACNLAATLEGLGLFILTVLLGLLLWGFIILPLIYYACTRRNPAQVYKGFSQAMATAFGTDSSNATLPITMRSAIAMGCDPRVVQFFLPLGTTVNMNGTALYEAVTVIFIAQAHGEVLGPAGTVIVALTATLAAVGAAGIPSAGLVTMLMVLQAVDLEQYAGDIAIILAVDWFLDRCRTVVNVLGDAFGTVIIDHHARKWVSSVPGAGRTDKASDGGADVAVPGDSGGGGGSDDIGIELGAAGGHMGPRGTNGKATGGIDIEAAPASSHGNHHHNNHHHHLGGLFHLSRSDPEGVRQGLLSATDDAEAAGGDPRVGSDVAAASNGSDWTVRRYPQGPQLPSSPPMPRSVASAAASAADSSASGSRRSAEQEFGPCTALERSSRLAGATALGSGPGAGALGMATAGSKCHVSSGSELHHRHPHVALGSSAPVSGSSSVSGMQGAATAVSVPTSPPRER